MIWTQFISLTAIHILILTYAIWSEKSVLIKTKIKLEELFYARVLQEMMLRCLLLLISTHHQSK